MQTREDRRLNKVSILLLIAFAAIFASACEKKGPAERAGEQIDDAMSEAADEADQIGDEIQDAAEDVKEKAEEIVD